jgi:hypothetical protein
MKEINSCIIVRCACIQKICSAVMVIDPDVFFSGGALHV